MNVWLDFVGKGEMTTAPRTLVEQALEPLIEDKSQRPWRVIDSLADIYVGGETAATNVGGFMVTRPPGDEHHPFWQALLALMQKTPSVFYWPGGGCIAADNSVAAQMPADMLESLGEPAIAVKPEDFWAQMR